MHHLVLAAAKVALVLQYPYPKSCLKTPVRALVSFFIVASLWGQCLQPSWKLQVIPILQTCKASQENTHLWHIWRSEPLLQHARTWWKYFMFQSFALLTRFFKLETENDFDNPHPPYCNGYDTKICHKMRGCVAYKSPCPSATSRGLSQTFMA